MIDISQNGQTGQSARCPGVGTYVLFTQDDTLWTGMVVKVYNGVGCAVRTLAGEIVVMPENHPYVVVAP